MGSNELAALEMAQLGLRCKREFLLILVNCFTDYPFNTLK